ncbi:MAG: glycoside hydrolase family 5 protein [Ruminiclostridium sp.]|nr:glycoside hydrolase family 5 protein [Ruminiclostridium sp.]
MKFKRMIGAISAAAMLFLFCSCSDGAQGAANTESTANTTSSEDANFAVDLGEMRGLTAKELVAEMKTGWNLGNSLDSIGKNELAWGNPKTTKEMIDAVRAQGFDILRIPVTWGQHSGGAPDYTVDPEFMARVKEVVNYGIANGMFVILDTHHEPDSWLKPQSESMGEVVPQFTALWQQISKEFADYGDHLVFEGINEARIKGSRNEWTGGTKDQRDCVNQLNKIFVDTVRESGGNNAKRLLLVATYAHSVTDKAFDGVVAEYDQYTCVALHAYTPYSFTYHSGESYETYKWDGREKGSIDGVFKLIKDKLTSKGIPVIITEYGAVRKTLEDGSDNTKEVTAWLNDYLGAAKEQGIPCVWWDNNYYNSGNELFGIFDRKNCKWYTQEVADAIINMYS